jgi:hypothetical protein
MRGLIAAACQTRDVANSDDEPEQRLKSAEDILDRLYYEDRSIDWSTRQNLLGTIRGAE